MQGAEAVRYPDPAHPGHLRRAHSIRLFFDELDAHAITSGAYADNPASAAVSRKVGDTANGTRLELRDETAAEHHKLNLTPDRFVRPSERVMFEGGAAMRAFVGPPDQARS